MRIWVVIPVYNVERYLARCLDSVLAAKSRLMRHRPESEVSVVCVNDGSTDGSRGILEGYGSRIAVVDKENGGLGFARNAGLDYIRDRSGAAPAGAYVIFVDSDDWIPEYSLYRFAAVAEASGARLVVSASFARMGAEPYVPEVMDDKDVRWRIRPREWIAGKKVQYSACNKLYALEVVKDRRFGNVVFEDFPWTTGILCDLDTLAVIDEPLYVYCTNPGTQSTVHSAFDGRKTRDSLKIVRQVLEYAAGRDGYPYALGRAADGLSSTVSKVYRSRNAENIRTLLDGVAELFRDFPDVRGKMTLRAKYRLWRMG